jgi:hypothetical protein
MMGGLSLGSGAARLAEWLSLSSLVFPILVIV